MSLVARYNMNGNANNSVSTNSVTSLSYPSTTTPEVINNTIYNVKLSQTITTPSDGVSLNSITLQLNKVGSPTGNLVVKCYTGQLTGLVATSSTIDVSTLGAAFASYTFNFAGETISPSTQYYFVLEPSYAIDNINYVRVGKANVDTGYTSGTGYWVDNVGVFVGMGADIGFVLNVNSNLLGTASNVTWVDGKENGAGSFNGTTSQITVNNSSALNITNDITISCLLNLTATPSGTYKGIIDKAYNTSYFFGIGSNTLGLGFFYGNTQVNTGVVLTVGKWHHVGVTYNRSTTTVKIFVDGVVVLTNASFNPTVSGNTSNVVIGRQQAAGYFLDGKIDALSIYNNTFTDADIKNDYLKYFGYYG